jgi:hypothetical protein
VPGSLQPPQRGVDRARREVQRAAAALLQRLDDRVAVQLPAVERGQQQRVEVAA